MNTTLSRRNLLKITAVSLAMLGIGAGGWSLFARKAMSQSGDQFSRALGIPPLNEGTLGDGVRVYDLSVQSGKNSFFPDLVTDTMGINGGFLGPVLRMRSGDKVRVNVTNNLTENTTLHWHGFNIPANADGGPHQMIKPDGVWSPEFTVREKASTMWYHSHLMGSTARQVWAGLAGMIIIDDDEADTLDLPDEYGVDDIPVILQDRAFYTDGSMPYDLSMHDLMMGKTGNFPLVNGVISPHLKTSSPLLRLRLLNGANASIYNMNFDDGREFQQISSDGGLLPEPVTLSSLKLSPGERAEIIVDVSNGNNTILRSTADVSNSGSGNMMGGMMSEQLMQFDFLEIRPKADMPSPAAIPAKLTTLEKIDPSIATKTRKFVLEMGGMMGRGFFINGKGMDMMRIDEVVKLGETEIWQIENNSRMAHPFHVHNTQFRIIDRDNQPPAPNEAGRKDTVLVNPNETVRILIRFDNYTDERLPYMFHCHILEHEDAGMMGQFTVVA